MERRRAQLAKRLRFYLPNAFARELEAFADILERLVAWCIDAETHSKNLLFARSQKLQKLARLLRKLFVSDRLVGRLKRDVLHEIPNRRSTFFARGRVETDGVARGLEQRAYLLDRYVHPHRDLLGGRLLAALLHHVSQCSRELVVRLDHMHGNANRASLIADGSTHALADPPARVGTEFVAAFVFELVDRSHEAEIAFLHQIEKVQPSVPIPLRNGYHEP